MTSLKFGVVDGLPAETVRTLALGPDGYLWVGTFGGLCRFDGAEFERFHAVDHAGLGSDRILDVLAAGDGTLWIGTELGGVSRYADGAFELVVPPERMRFASAVVEAPDGAIWIAGDGVTVVHEGAVERLTLADVPVDVHSIDIDGDGRAWLVTNTGLFAAERTAAGFDVELLSEEALSGQFVDAGGERWLTLLGGGYARLDGLDRPHTGLDVGSVHDQYRLSADEVLLAAGSGLYRARGTGDGLELTLESSLVRPRAFVPYGPSDVWIGTRRNGLISLNAAHFDLIDLTGDQEQPSVGAVVADGDGRIVAIAQEADAAWTLHRDAFEATPLGATRAYSVVPAAGAGFMLLDDVGLAVARDGALRRALSAEHIHPTDLGDRMPFLFRGPRASVWMWIEDTLVEIDEDGAPLRACREFGPRPTFSVVTDSAILFLRGDEVIRFGVDQLTPSRLVSIEGAALRSAMVDERGDLWLTTYGQGLARLTPGGRLDRWSTHDGLVDDHLGWVGTARDADGIPRLWLNSNAGVFAVAFESLQAALERRERLVMTHHLATPEGNGAYGAIARDGALLLPTIDGLLRIDPARIRFERTPPRPIVTGVRLNGLPPVGRFTSGVDLEVQFTGIAFPSGRNVAFQHRLLGYDDEWVDDRDQRRVRYPRLPHGDYVFEVRARAADGPWSEPTAALAGVPLRIEPLWYERHGVWFIGLVLTAVVAYGMFNLGTTALRRRADAMAEEIERRRAAEAELERSRADHLAVLETANDGLLSVDRHGTVLYANGALCRLLGRNVQSVVGRGLDRIGLARLRNRMSDVLRGAVGANGAVDAPGAVRSFESVVERADGREAEVECSIAWDVPEGPGDVRGPERTTIVVRDITERRAMIDALRASEERFRTLFRTIPCAVFVWRPNLQVVDWNDVAGSTFGFTEDAAHPPILLDLFPARARIERFRLAIERVLSGSERVAVVQSARTSEGGERRFRWTFTPLLGPGGVIRSVITLASDITDDERRAVELEALRKKLVRAEETERSRIARELHDDLSQRLAALALDLQASSLAAGASPEAQRSAAARVQRGIEAVARDVHDLSRKLHPTVLDDLGLARALASECERRARIHGVEIECSDRTDGVEPDREIALTLFRVAQEALQNATKHSGAERFRVELHRAQGQRIRLSIHDDGAGFDEASQSRSASPGLGLASMGERARLIGAELSVRSRVGSGTTVTVVAPLRSPVDAHFSAEE